MVLKEIEDEVKRVYGELKKETPGTEAYKQKKQDYLDLIKERRAEEESDLKAGIDDRRIELAEKEFKLKADEAEAEKKMTFKQWIKAKVNPNIVLKGLISGAMLALLIFGEDVKGKIISPKHLRYTDDLNVK